ncbi:MAG: peroxiredoxin [Deltaproteobacteria bacterium]|nr:peroxiredoxin [Deltaproteobacteria bacterium]
MSIKVGDKIPEIKLKWLTADGMSEVNTAELFAGRTVVLFSVPGAYTPTCSMEHLPGFISRAGDIKGKGVDDIICLAVNDPFVMMSWGKEQGAEGKVTMLPDWHGDFSSAMGLTQDISVAGLGVRGKRFSMRVVDGVVQSLDVEEGKGVSVSGADQCLVNLA